ncbi:MAG TPA: hypothetical protein VFG69_16065, partial [Nannocystaceae bacterium]|nr:hypothetical protein [Nannocystaceae bacterium]
GAQSLGGETKPAALAVRYDAAMRSPALVSLALAAACFSDPPTASSDTSTGSTTAADESTSRATSRGDTTSLTSAVDSTSNEVDASGAMSATGDVTTTLSDSTGSEPEECQCPEPNVFCDGFEDWPGPWMSNPDGDGTTMPDPRAPRCGLAAGHTQVDPDDLYALLQGPLETSAQELTSKPYSVHAFVDVEPSCTQMASFVRVLELRLGRTGGGLWYRWVVAVHGDQVRLTAANEFAVSFDWFSESALPDGWGELRLDVDYATSPPSAQLWVDGAMTIESTFEGPPITDGAFQEKLPPHSELGPFYYDAPFMSECTVRYDHVWVAGQ